LHNATGAHSGWTSEAQVFAGGGESRVPFHASATCATALAKMSPARQAVEIARIESRMSSNGHVSTGADRAWTNPSTRSGRVSDEDWKRSYGANLSDEQFNKEFDRRMQERGGRRR
jgi:hypothetical protein